jgi:hypothetical protein
LPAKHAVRTFGTARAVLSFAVAVLVSLVVWTAMRAVGPAQASRQPTVVLPSTPQQLVEAPRSPSATPSRTVTPSRVPTSPVPKKTRKPTAKPAPTTARTKAAATLTVGWSRGRGYFANVRVVNNGTRPLQWRVTVTHSERDDVRLGGVWGATGSQQDESMVFRGGPLAPGASVFFGYQAMRDGRGDARPIGCSVVGGTCGMR